MKIKVSELFYSLQGEGRYVGTPSIFLRTFGCNFTCGGFGMPKGEVSQERKVIADYHKIKPYTSYSNLPLVSTGCDSYASWDPAFKDLSPMIEVDDLVDQMDQLLPGWNWGNVHLVITGGEPLLGWQRAYPDLLRKCQENGLRYLTFETNGTQKLQQEFLDYLRNDFFPEITFSVSPKLAVSGETYEDAIRPEAIDTYLSAVARGMSDHWRQDRVYLKFVVNSEDDIHQIDRILKENVGTFNSPLVDIYLMPVGGTDELYYQNNKRVAALAMERGWKYSPRLQVDIWKNAWGT